MEESELGRDEDGDFEASHEADEGEVSSEE